MAKERLNTFNLIKEGETVASGASRLEAGTLLIEKENELGGDCLHFGGVPSKTLIKTAHVYHRMK